MKWLSKLSLIIFVLFLPIALMSIFVPPNEYIATGIGGGIDCDGPFEVMIFAFPTYLVYGLSTLIFIMAYIKTKKLSYLSASLICCIIIIAITPNVIGALDEHHKNKTEHKETCEIGW